jgi:integrase/recombinase XerD
MGHLCEYSWSLHGRLEGPLVPYFQAFVALLSDQGYASTSAYQRARFVAGFSRWLKKHNIVEAEIALHHVDRYLRYRGNKRCRRTGNAAALRQLLELLQQKQVIRQQPSITDNTPVQRLLDEYALYLRKERMLAAPTQLYYLRFNRYFLTERFGTGRAQLSLLQPSDVVEFVKRQAAQLSPEIAKLVTTALRSFLRYARYRGYITNDLAAAAPTVAHWSMSSIPRSIAPEHVRDVLARCKLHGPLRDYAILLLLSRLGLRASEIVHLQLGDIDWHQGSLTLNGKGGHRSTLPLPTDVGKALAAYLKKERPRNTSSRSVFLRAKAPIRNFKNGSAVSSIVRHALAQAGINVPSKGAHQFRHALACNMLRQGASLSEIGQILGHRSLQTTAIYAKVDLGSLKLLALPWPGGVR